MLDELNDEVTGICRNTMFDYVTNLWFCFCYVHVAATAIFARDGRPNSLEAASDFE